MNRPALTLGILTTFIAPVVTLISILRSVGHEGKRFLLTLLIVVYGVTLPLTERADGFRHKQMVINEYMDMSWARFVDDLVKILTFEVSSSSTDVYKHVISYISGAIFSAPFLFFFIVSLVYGYFYSGVVLQIFRNYRFNSASLGLFFWGFVTLFFLNKGVEGIQTVRTWTGLWVLLYAVMMYDSTQNRKYLFLLLFPPLIHFGYFLMAIPAYLILIFGIRHKLIALVFILSTSINFYNPETLANSTFRNFSLINLKINQYERSEEELTMEALLDRKNQKNNIERTWYKKLEIGGYFKWVNNLLMYVLIFFQIAPRFMNRLEQRLFAIGLATLAGSNVLFFIFAASNRMHVIGLTFILASLVMLFIRSRDFQFFTRQNSFFKAALGSYFILSIPQFIYLVSFFLSQISAYMILLPFVPMIDDGANIALIDVIKRVIGFSI